MNVTLRIENMDQLLRILNDLNDNAKKSVIKTGYQTAARPLVQAAKAGTNSKRIKQSIGVEVSSKGVGLVGARKTKLYQGFLAKFFEDGTKERQYTRKKFLGKAKTHRTGRIKATNFFSKAVQSTEKQVAESLFQSFKAAMEKIISKYAK